MHIESLHISTAELLNLFQQLILASFDQNVLFSFKNKTVSLHCQENVSTSHKQEESKYSRITAKIQGLCLNQRLKQNKETANIKRKWHVRPTKDIFRRLQSILLNCRKIHGYLCIHSVVTQSEIYYQTILKSQVPKNTSSDVKLPQNRSESIENTNRYNAHDTRRKATIQNANSYLRRMRPGVVHR